MSCAYVRLLDMGGGGRRWSARVTVGVGRISSLFASKTPTPSWLQDFFSCILVLGRREEEEERKKCVIGQCFNWAIYSFLYYESHNAVHFIRIKLR